MCPSSAMTRRRRCRIARRSGLSCRIPTRSTSWLASAGITAAINSRIAPVYRILVSAAASDPDRARSTS